MFYIYTLYVADMLELYVSQQYFGEGFDLGTTITWLLFREDHVLA